MKLVAAYLVAMSVFAQSSTPITYPNVNANYYATQEAQAVPTSATAITTANVIFGGGWVACGATARTITITDGNAVAVMTAVPIAANQIVSLAILSGAYISKGFLISASGAGCTYSAWWRQ